ncbi:pyocin knob domain-containing protein [Brachybacterium massiliense]|uniref:pyocin knob domain-containing protein n=1 Tax=Brachybacterium massiliense TaxID=1755098 RepID=UPI000B3BD02B|nr:pyocin knob domain-containing protein [Brachybacterium massiliense]
MTSTIVPPVDLAPGMPSRVVTISATDVTEGGTSLEGQMVRFALSDTLDVTSGGDVIAKTQAEVVLDSNGEGRIRLPVYDEDVKTWCGKDWAILVTASWGSQKAIRVPAGTSAIALSALPNIRPLRGREVQWALTGAGITVVEGSQWGATVSLDGGVLQFVLTVPPGGTAWYKGALGSSADLDTLADGAYVVVNGDVAEAIGLPESLNGVVESYEWVGLQRYHVKTTGEQRTWQRSRFSDGWASWERVDGNSWFKGNLDEQDATTLAGLGPGLYLVRYVGTAEAFGLPQRLIGQLEVVDAGTQRRITFAPNDSGSGFGAKAVWEVATNSEGNLRDRWQRSDKHIMRSAPVVLTAPAGEYGPVAVSREAVRLPFTVPTNVSRVRVHMRPWNYRTEIEWGPARLEGVMIAQAAQNGLGTITGSRWYAPNAAGATVPGAGWTSEWFHVGLTPGSTFLLSYGAEWLDASRDLVSGKCWAHADRAKYDTTEEAVYGNGWGGFTLQPMDIWIECEAPSNVPINMYIGASNNVFAGTSSVFMSYPTQHARRNGAFCALTAAGGWSIMDASMHKADIINRFGYPTRIADRIYLDMGSNIEARGATAQEAIAEMERWMNTRLNALGNPPVHLLTQISRWTSDSTGDSYGTLSDWNQWIRYEATKRPEVVALHDQAAMFADPEKPWTARVELRESPTDVHFSEMGQKLRAQALDGEITLPMLTAKNPSEIGGVTYVGDGVYEIN